LNIFGKSENITKQEAPSVFILKGFSNKFNLVFTSRALSDPRAAGM